jgi:hypothetical protein
MKKPNKDAEMRLRLFADLKSLPYYSKLPKDYKWPYQSHMKDVNKKARPEDFGLEIQFWQIGLLQLASMFLLFLLMKFFVESIFNNPSSGRHVIIHSVVDAILLDFTRHTILSNLPYLILIFIGVGLTIRAVFVFWRYLYIWSGERGLWTWLRVIASILYFIIIYAVVPISLFVYLVQYFWSVDLKYFVVFFLSLILIAPPTILGTLTVLTRKERTGYVMLTVTVSVIILYALVIYTLISEDIQQSIHLPSFITIANALLFGALFGSYLLVTRLFMVYKHRVHYTLDRFEERPSKNMASRTQYIQYLNRALTKMLYTNLLVFLCAMVAMAIPVALLYVITNYGPKWAQQSYELNSVYGLLLPFVIMILVLLVIGNILTIFYDRGLAEDDPVV